MRRKLIFALAVVISFTLIGAIVYVVFSRLITFRQISENIVSVPIVSTSSTGNSILYNPPKPEDAPLELRETVMFGYNIMNDTRKYAGEYVGNKLRCSSCHFNGGMTTSGREGGLSLVGVVTKYPAYVARAKGEVDILARTNSCFERSMNGKPLPLDSKEMVALVTYYQWISKGLPVYENIPWLGLKPIKSDHKPDAENGKLVYATQCASCHGTKGEGTMLAPPIWGEDSFNDGAGMSTSKDFAAFVFLHMPRGNPDLSTEEALDLAGFVKSQPRPHFEAHGKNVPNAPTY